MSLINKTLRHPVHLQRSEKVNLKQDIFFVLRGTNEKRRKQTKVFLPRVAVPVRESHFSFNPPNPLFVHFSPLLCSGIYASFFFLDVSAQELGVTYLKIEIDPS